jgi:hypothetical protein
LTNEEKAAVSEFIRQYKAKHPRKRATTKRKVLPVKEQMMSGFERQPEPIVPKQTKHET